MDYRIRKSGVHKGRIAQKGHIWLEVSQTGGSKNQVIWAEQFPREISDQQVGSVLQMVVNTLNSAK